MIDKQLTVPDTVEGFEDLQREVRHDTRRRRALLGIAAAVVLVVAASAVLMQRNAHSAVEPAGKPDTTFRSAAYGYSIALPQGWTTVPATTGTTGHGDLIRIPGTDTTIEVSADYLGRQSFNAWANQLYHATRNDPGVPANCTIVQPLEWPRFRIGTTQGYLFQKCNQALGIAKVGNRVYVFIWGNQTLVEGKHYAQSRFQKLLAGVHLPDAATASKPLG